MSIQCKSCGDYMFQGTKCNCRKELCYSEFYLGINVYRIYLHCKSCYAEITIKTDPKNCDYIVEKGATRHFEPWRDYQVEQALEMKRRCAGDIVQEAEERTVDTQRDMEQKRDLGRLCAVSGKQDRVDVAAIRPEPEAPPDLLTEEDRKKLELFDRPQRQPLIRDELLRPLPRFNGKWGPGQGLLGCRDSDDD
jgi:hypothetical protein